MTNKTFFKWMLAIFLITIIAMMVNSCGNIVSANEPNEPQVVENDNSELDALIAQRQYYLDEMQFSIDNPKYFNDEYHKQNFKKAIDKIAELTAQIEEEQ